MYPCPEGWTYQGRSCYIIKNKAEVYSVNYDAAYAYCYGFGPTVHLVAIESEEEQHFLVDELLVDRGMSF